MASAFKKDELQYADIEVKIDRAGRRHRTPGAATSSCRRRRDRGRRDPGLAGARTRRWASPTRSVGDYVREPLEQTPQTGRIAAQTAKQVVLQRLREAEREVVFDEFTGKEGELVSGTVLRVEPGRRQVIIDLGRSEAVLPGSEQVRAGALPRRSATACVRERGLPRLERPAGRRLALAPRAAAAAVRARSARDGARHRRDHGHRSRAGLPLEDRSDLAAARHRPDRRVRRRARLAHPEHRQRARRRAHRPHPLGPEPGRVRRERAQPRRGRLDPHG